jgi:hypothetical protein
MKQEILEELAKERYSLDKEINERIAFKRGYTECSEAMYSEEDLREAFRQGQDNMDYSDTYGWDSKLTEQVWFEQFKKK